MSEKIYICGLIIITVCVVVYYMFEISDYQDEMRKINDLEYRERVEQKELDIIRSQTTPCHIGTFQTPRNCYVDSGRMCSWNERAKRCDAK